jgi:hypothetical protein
LFLRIFWGNLLIFRKIHADYIALLHYLSFQNILELLF